MIYLSIKSLPIRILFFIIQKREIYYVVEKSNIYIFIYSRRFPLTMFIFSGANFLA